MCSAFIGPLTFLFNIGVPLAAAPSPVAAGIAIEQVQGVSKTADRQYQYEFGNVSLLDGRDIRHTFTLKNTTKQTITLTSVQTSCGCTTAVVRGKKSSALPLTLDPGDDAKLEVTLAADHLYPGKAQKYVWINTKEAPGQITILMDGQVDAAAHFDPPILDFGQVRAGKTATIPVTITIDPRLAPRIGDMLGTSDANLVITQTDDPARLRADAAAKEPVVRHYRVSLSNHPQLGIMMGTISLMPKPGETMGERDLAGCWANLSGEITGSIAGDPKSIAFGELVNGKGGSQDITLTGQGLTPTNIKLFCASEYLQAGATAGKEPGTITLHVSVSPKMPWGSLSTQVIVTGPTGEQLALPALVTVARPASP